MDVKIEEGYEEQRFRFRFRTLLGYAGPGLIMCIAFIDPGNLESDLLTGAVTGYSLLWMIPLCSFMGLIMQQFAAKLGMVTGKHLAQVCRTYYPSLPRYLIWILMELAVISADMQEVIGSAIAIRLLSQDVIPLYIGIIVTAFDTFILLFLGSWGAQKLEMFFGLLVAIMCIMFGIIYFSVEVPHSAVLKGLVVPDLNNNNLSYALGMLGALIMPHNIYLHSACVVTRYQQSSGIQYKKEGVLYSFLESAFAIFLTVFINVFVVAVFAHGFFDKNLENIGLMTAGDYLRTEFGQVVATIWGLGLLAAGQASTMSGTYTGQFIMSGFINLKFSPFIRVLITRTMTIIPALLIVFLSHSKNALDALNQYINLLQAILLPFALLPILSVTNDEEIMGSLKNTWWERTLMYGCIALIFAINFQSIVLQEQQTFTDQKSVLESGLTVIIALAYVIFVIYLFIFPFIKQKHNRKGMKGEYMEQEDVPLLSDEVDRPGMSTPSEG